MSNDNSPAVCVWNVRKRSRKFLYPTFACCPFRWFEKVCYYLISIYYETRKYPLRGYIQGVLTHTTAWDRHLGDDEILEWVLICAKGTAKSWYLLYLWSWATYHANPRLIWLWGDDTELIWTKKKENLIMKVMCIRKQAKERFEFVWLCITSYNK